RAHGGMLVQKRSPDTDAPAGVPVPTIRVKVKFNGVYHEIYINSQASFGELKKLLSARMGLHPEDQKLVYKDKERGSKAFLDMAGVKDSSKMVLLEDPAAQAKRLLEQRRTDKADPAGDGIPRRIRSVAARGGRIWRARMFLETDARKIASFKRGFSPKLMKTLANSKCATFNKFVSDALTQENQNNIYSASKSHKRAYEVGASQSKAPIAARP
ncbi:BAG family molecular chaperone regulator 1-like, partial [Miscanthus floridulus]|uniref:BAG family molecular chaperone regulator 1-like n=1 Tax=Miscanthus floridulus TaxID=154761 RepID=UPI003457BB11